MSSPDTIFALSSGPLPAAVAVVRLSGDRVRSVLADMAGSVPQARRAVLRRITSVDDALLDMGLVIFFPGPNSFTGEDVAELQLHGSRAGVAAVLADLSRRPGLRMAEAGEFTRRAFLNGRLDLTEVEALADLISAETEAQRRFALQNSGGAQRLLYEAWRGRIIRARAMIEAELDFSDERDVPASASDPSWADVADLLNEVDCHHGSYHRAEIIRDGYDVVILGPPNAGKSSLLNALAQRDVAIVTDEPGTTRDLIEVALDLNGLKVRITDTAGVRNGAGKVEKIGIERALDRAAQADLVILLDDGSANGPTGLPANLREAIRVRSKMDLGEAVDGGGLNVSAVTGQGLGELLGLIESGARHAVGLAGEVLPSRQRHKDVLLRVTESLEEALAMRAHGLELSAEALRRASDWLGRLTGQTDVEDLLDVIFAEFCIGK